MALVSASDINSLFSDLQTKYRARAGSSATFNIPSVTQGAPCLPSVYSSYTGSNGYVERQSVLDYTTKPISASAITLPSSGSKIIQQFRDAVGQFRDDLANGYKCSSCIGVCVACSNTCNTSCNNTCNTSCSGKCNTACTNNCYTSSCSGGCYTNVCSNKGCGAYCKLGCFDYCTSCSGICDSRCVGCTNNCYSACKGSGIVCTSSTCRNSCSSSTCSKNCSGTCRKARCQNAYCGSTGGVYSCQGGCHVDCVTYCSDNCTANCISNCSGTCSKSCSSTCSNGCGSGCSKSCGSGCSNSCNSICTNKCSAGCGTGCTSTARIGG